MTSLVHAVVPFLPSADIQRDVAWYQKHVGFEPIRADANYAILKKEALVFHLQWHAGTEEDPLLGGSVVKIFVSDVGATHKDLLMRQTVGVQALRRNTPWGTHEVGFYDLNNNAIFFVENT